VGGSLSLISVAMVWGVLVVMVWGVLVVMVA